MQAARKFTSGVGMCCVALELLLPLITDVMATSTVVVKRRIDIDIHDHTDSRQSVVVSLALLRSHYM